MRSINVNPFMLELPVVVFIFSSLLSKWLQYGFESARPLKLICGGVDAHSQEEGETTPSEEGREDYA
jgi:hypothetical protein